MTQREPAEWSLATLQTWFLNVTTHPESARAGVEAQSNRVSLADLATVVRPGEKESPLDRLDIYHHGYFARFTECLADDFPTLKFVLGEAAFSDLCHAYVTSHPSRDPNLNGFGRGLPRFMQQSGGNAALFASELAQLEWALVEALHAREQATLSANALTEIPPQELPGVRFELSETLRLLSFQYPVNAYLQAFYEAREPTIPAPARSSVAVVRNSYTLWRFDLNLDQSSILSRLLAGEALGSALDGIGASAADVRLWFSEWTKHGLFTGLRGDGA